MLARQLGQVRIRPLASRSHPGMMQLAMVPPVVGGTERKLLRGKRATRIFTEKNREICAERREKKVA
jgi:hypothetical protein